MSELKTLKDMENGFKVVGIRELRQEAIKWVKSKNIHKTSGQISFIKFFNLTEEDMEADDENN